MYEPRYLQRWAMPKCYLGAEWPEYYGSGFGRTRDSDALERANFDTAWQAIEKAAGEATTPDGEYPAVQIVRENHWAVGWIEWIAIHETCEAALSVADDLKERYENYPCLDESLWSEYESDEANSVWKDCYSWQERIAYIREHDSQFDFRDFADLCSCVRGEYFAGYASELIR